MKLRNKKTGEIGDLLGTERAAGLIIIDIDFYDGNPIAFDYTSIAELNKDWEDYKPAKPEPLIKDEKIRKAVRAWAGVNKYERLSYWCKDGEGCFSFFDRESENEIMFDNLDGVKGITDDKTYTIAELCGEEEE